MSQANQIANHLYRGNSISPLEALGVFQCYRLAARINDLRERGMKIVTEIRHDATGKKYARYTYVGCVRVFA